MEQQGRMVKIPWQQNNEAKRGTKTKPLQIQHHPRSTPGPRYHEPITTLAKHPRTTCFLEQQSLDQTTPLEAFFPHLVEQYILERIMKIVCVKK